MKVIIPPRPAGDDAAERVVLRDGSVATLRPSRHDDAPALKRFFHDLSPESRRRRFFTLAEPGDALVEKLSDSSNPARALTLLAIRIVDGEARPIAVGSYLGETPTAAEVAFAVDDRFHGKGLGTVLLERLATAAIAHGFRRFEGRRSPRTRRCWTSFANRASKFARGPRAAPSRCRCRSTPRPRPSLPKIAETHWRRSRRSRRCSNRAPSP